jgi:hypothetical protein
MNLLHESSIFINDFSLFRTVSKLIKSAIKYPKTTTTTDDSPPTPAKPHVQPPVVHPRPSSVYTMTRSATISNTESPQMNRSDSTNESSHTKPSMSTSLYSSLVLPNNNSEQKDSNNSAEPVTSPGPPVTARMGKTAIGTRVLPVLDPNGDAPPIKLRHFQGERKGIKRNRMKIFNFISSPNIFFK